MSRNFSLFLLPKWTHVYIVHSLCRISIVFKVKSARKINLSDKVLAQRFLPILGVSVAYLAAWTAVGTPEVIWRVNSSDLKFKDCSSTFWGIIVYVGEFMKFFWLHCIFSVLERHWKCHEVLPCTKVNYYLKDQNVIFKTLMW